MFGDTAKSMKATAGLRRLLAMAVLAAAVALPVAAQASVIVTFDWVSGGPTPENPSSAKTTTPNGTLELLLSSFTLTSTGSGNLGPNYYTSGSATTATIVAFSYTAGNGLTVSTSNLSTTTLGSTIWATSASDTPYSGTLPGYYLISGFSVSGTTPESSPFKIANAAGTANANYANGIGNADNSFNAAGSIPAITDGGYWELQSVTAVPLPLTLPLLLSGIGGLAVIARRRRFAAI
jgi:hypothetical protein